MPLLSQILLPYNDQVVLKLNELVPVLIRNVRIGSKGQQIFHLSTLKILMHNYIVDQQKIE